MLPELKQSLWQQFGAAIDMLDNAIALWPGERWDTDERFFYMAYHCVVFLDYYLTDPPENFAAGLSFTIKEFADRPPGALDDIIPDKIYTKAELLDYLRVVRGKCMAIIAGLAETRLSERWIEKDSGRNYSIIEILLYNMRHVQHHAAQLNLMLRQTINDAPGWVARARKR